MAARRSVRDGAIVGKSHEPIVTSTYCLTKQHFSDFRLTCKVARRGRWSHSNAASYILYGESRMKYAKQRLNEVIHTPLRVFCMEDRE